MPGSSIHEDQSKELPMNDIKFARKVLPKMITTSNKDGGVSQLNYFKKINDFMDRNPKPLGSNHLLNNDIVESTIDHQKIQSNLEK